MTEKSKNLIKQITLPIGILLALFTLFNVLIYFFIFRTNFERKTWESSDIKHFAGTENLEKNKKDTEWFYSQNPEEITIQSYDGLKLLAYNLPAENAKGTWLLIHGHQSGPLREFAGLAKFFHELGYNVVLPYQRSHGKSEGKYITFGIKERYDVRDWLLKINEIYGDQTPLYIEGISMGASTLLMSLSFDLPLNLKSVVADCSFTSPYDIIWKVAKKDSKVPLPRLVILSIDLMSRTLADFDLSEYNTFMGLRYNRRPVLFIHGTEDDYVPIEMTIANYQYCTSEKYLYLVQNSPHAISYFIDEENYHEKLIEFCGLNLE